MAHYAIQLDDGTVALMQTVGDATPEACLAKWTPEARARVVGGPRRIDPAAIPESREFRDAWRLEGNSVVHDLDRAKDIVRERFRRAREPQLKALDIAYLRADESGDLALKAEITAEKAALRDAPADPAIAAADSVEALKGLTLDGVVAAALAK